MDRHSFYNLKKERFLFWVFFKVGKTGGKAATQKEQRPTRAHEAFTTQNTSTCPEVMFPHRIPQTGTR